MLGGYQWDSIDFSKINFGADEATEVDYGGHRVAVPSQNFDGHGASGAPGPLNNLIDLDAGGWSQQFGGADDSMDFEGPLDNAGDHQKNDKQKFDSIIGVLDDLYSFEHAKEAVPALKAYFGLDATVAADGAPAFKDVKSFLNPASLEKAGSRELVLGLSDLTMENPPCVITPDNRRLVITPASLIDAFLAKDTFEPAERYHVRKNIIACLTALAEMHRHRNDLPACDLAGLVMQVQQCRLKSSVDYQYARGAASSVVAAADREAHVKELTRRTLARLQQGMHLQHAAPDFDALNLQRPGNAGTLETVRSIQAVADEYQAEKLARLTLDQMADLLVETRPDWRLPLKTAVAGAVADYLGVTIEGITAAQINATRIALLNWAEGRLRAPPDIAMVLACIPSLCRETVLQADPVTRQVNEVPLKHAQDILLPSAIAKAIKTRMSHLESRVAGLVKNEAFYSEIYRQGKSLQTSLNLHGMYLQCSNPANRNLAFQTPEQFNHRVYATRCSSGLYVNNTNLDNPRLECREGAALRLNYIDKLWSLFRVIVMDTLRENLAIMISDNQAFHAENDPEKQRQIASDLLDRCVPETFDCAAGNLTGITRSILVNAAIQKVRPVAEDIAH